MTSISGMPYKLELIDCKTNSVIFIFDGSYGSLSIDWSPNSRYISISSGNRFNSYVDVFDVKTLKFIDVSNLVEIENIIRERFTYTFRMSVYTYFSFDEWIDNDKIKIIGWMSNGSIPQKYQGWYIFDIVEGKIIEEDIQKIEEN